MDWAVIGGLLIRSRTSAASTALSPADQPPGAAIGAYGVRIAGRTDATICTVSRLTFRPATHRMKGAKTSIHEPIITKAFF